jgi:NAD+ kinase
VKTVGIVCNPKKPEAERVLLGILDWLLGKGIAVCVEEGASELLKEKSLVCQSGELAGRSDLLIAMGGDGTLLKTARLVAVTETPILGVNIGSLGFLTETVEDEVYTILEDILGGSYEIDRRMLIQARLSESEHVYEALNDIVVLMGESGRIVEIVLHVSGDYVCTFPADGVVISTPTGSTAYSLAAGGPIVYPSMDCILVTPICPHSLGVRPIIVPSTENVQILARSRADDARLVVDGQESIALRSGAVVEIEKAAHYLQLIKPKKKSFFEILRTKLRWGGREEGRASRPQS